MPSLLVYVVGDRLGDGLFKLPCMTALRAAFPSHRITWLAGQRQSVFAGPLAPLAEDLVDEVIDEAGVGSSLAELLRRPLAGRYFDIVMDTQQSVRTALLLRRVAHGLFVSPALGFRLSDRRPPAGVGVPLSVRGRFLQLVELASGRPATFPPPGLPLPLPLPAELRALARQLLPSGPVYVGVAPGAGGENKRWPLAAFAQVAKRAARRGCVPVFLLGPDERAWQEPLAAQVSGARFPEWEARAEGCRGPLLSLALAERLTAGVANDAGPGHILAAVGCPLLTLYGRTRADKFSEPSPSWLALRAQDFGGRDVSAIPVDAVSEALERLISRST